MLGVLSCSSDSPSSSVPLCTATASDGGWHRTVTDGANELDMDMSPTSTEMRLVVDGSLAFDATAVSTPQGWSETVKQGPAYSGQEQHVIHLLRGDTVVTGDVDGKPLAPFPKDADASTVHFADGTPFDAGVAPASQHILDTYKHLQEVLSSGTCVAADGSSVSSVPAQPEYPQDGENCRNCHLQCTVGASLAVFLGLVTCAAVWDGQFFGIPLAVCLAVVIVAAVLADNVCNDQCNELGNQFGCCPVPCGVEGQGHFCCDYGSTCSSEAQHLCCPGGTTSCNQNCCDSGTETCTSEADSTCCPNDRACNGGTVCCPEGQPCDAKTDTCCGPADVCPNPANGTTTCCTGGNVCNPDGTCTCPAAATQCGGECCFPGSVCATTDQTCCNITISGGNGGARLCGGHCCGGPCMTLPGGAQDCCPASCVVDGACCGSGQTCVDGACH